MRTTLTLDDDVMARLRAETRRSGKSFKAVVNELLRRSLAAPSASPRRAPFAAKVRDLGELRPGISLDNIGELLDRLDGDTRR